MRYHLVNHQHIPLDNLRASQLVYQVCSHREDQLPNRRANRQYLLEFRPVNQQEHQVVNPLLSRVFSQQVFLLVNLLDNLLLVQVANLVVNHLSSRRALQVNLLRNRLALLDNRRDNQVCSHRLRLLLRFRLEYLLI